MIITNNQAFGCGKMKIFLGDLETMRITPLKNLLHHGLLVAELAKVTFGANSYPTEQLD